MRISFFFLLIILFTSCNFKKEEKSKVKTYFDLEGYFKKEASRLKNKNEPIVKTVWINGKSEQKKIIIKNWEKEFSVFIDADINKSSWRGSFKKSIHLTPYSNNAQASTLNYEVTIYTSTNEKIAVKQILISKKEDKINFIKVFIHNNNALYTSTDSLSYFPDSAYQIKKLQHIKLMEEKRYLIEGRFGH